MGKKRHRSPYEDSPLHSVTMQDARSWARDQVFFSRGINVIVGASDSGKSNVLRNIRTAAFNDSPASAVVRAGKSGATISLFFSGTADVKLAQGVVYTKSNFGQTDYDIITSPGEPNLKYEKVGRELPDEARRAIGLGPYKFGDEEVDLHFATQRGPAFLVDWSPSKIARLVGGVSGLDVLFRAQASAEKERRAASVEVKVAAGVLRSARASLKEFAEKVDVKAARAKLAAASRAVAALQSAEATLADLNMGVEAINRARQLSQRSASPAAAKATAAMSEVEKYAARVADLQAAVRQYDRAIDAAAIIAAKAVGAANNKRSAEDALHRLEREYKVCPYCGGSFDRRRRP